MRRAREAVCARVKLQSFGRVHAPIVSAARESPCWGLSHFDYSLFIFIFLFELRKGKDFFSA